MRGGDLIRPYRKSDLPFLRALHKEFHAPNGEVFPHPEAEAAAACFVDERDGVIVGAVIVRLTAELFGIGHQTHGTPLDRFEVISGLISAGAFAAAKMGIEEVHCAVPPSIHRYGARLVEMGHTRDNRTWYTVDCAEQLSRIESAKEKAS